MSLKSTHFDGGAGWGSEHSLCAIPRAADTVNTGVSARRLNHWLSFSVAGGMMDTALVQSFLVMVGFKSVWGETEGSYWQMMCQWHDCPLFSLCFFFPFFSFLWIITWLTVWLWKPITSDFCSQMQLHLSLNIVFCDVILPCVGFHLHLPFLCLFAV